jgi:hypothetical protein
MLKPRQINKNKQADLQLLGRDVKGGICPARICQFHLVLFQVV